MRCDYCGSDVPCGLGDGCPACCDVRFDWRIFGVAMLFLACLVAYGGGLK